MFHVSHRQVPGSADQVKYRLGTTSLYRDPGCVAHSGNGRVTAAGPASIAVNKWQQAPSHQ